MRTGKITTFALVMLITGAVDSIRNLATASLFGTSLIFFFLLSAIVFLIPSALVSAELASGNADKSGIFQWVKAAFGEEMGFIAIWLQWITNLVWFPTILSFIAGLFSNLIDPSLSQSKTYLISMILIVFWSLTLFNLKGVRVSAKFTSFCAVVGMVIPMTLIILLAIFWLATGHASQIHFTSSNMLPTIGNTDTWISLTAIMTAFAGMELAAVHIKDVKDPQKAYPKALLFSVLLIIVTMLFGSLAIAVILPQKDISLVNGVMQTFTTVLATYHLAWTIPVITLMILIGTVGGIVSWVISPAKGLLQAAQLGYLPHFLQKINSHGVAVNLLIMQAIIVSAVCCAFLLMPSVSGSYWLLTALAEQLYIVMYVMMFVTGIYSRYKFSDEVHAFKIPGGNYGMWITCILGLIGCAITILVGFCPPVGVDVGGLLHYELVFCSGMVLMILPVAFFFYYKKKQAALVV